MKKAKVLNQSLVLAITITALNQSTVAAIYDPMEQRENSSNPSTLLDKELHPGPSIIESLQQSKSDDTKANYLEILELIKQKKLSNAQEKISSFLKKYPSNSIFYDLQGLLETENKNTPAAQQSYEKALQINANDVLAHLSLAKLYIDSGALDKAKEWTTKALTINDKNVNAYLLLADIAYKQKNNPEVEKILLQAKDTLKGDTKAEIEIITNLSKFYALENKLDQILVLAEDLVKRYPVNTEALSILVGAQLANKKNDLAEKTLRELISLDKQQISHRLLLVRLISAQPDREAEILPILEEADASTPNNPQILFYKTAYLTKFKRYAEAYEVANKADTLFPKQALGKVLKGDVSLAEKKLDNAVNFYQQGYKIEPNEKILFTLVDLMAAQKKLPDALTLLKKELAKNPKNNAVHFKLATIYQQQTDYTQAETHYQAIINNQPDNVLALNNLAWMYAQQNKYPKAAELAQKAYSKAPESADIADTYGSILIKTGQATEGLAVLEKAVKIAPKLNEIQFHLAEAYVANNNPQKAIELLEVITKAEQDFTEKKAALGLLEKLKSK